MFVVGRAVSYFGLENVLGVVRRMRESRVV
jgi:hypothetical protein